MIRNDAVALGMKEFGPFRLDIADQSLWRDNRRIHLTPKAFAILQYLIERAGRLVTHNELLEAHWADTFVQPEVLKSQILDIRNALHDSAKDAQFIETVPRRGYRFIAAVQEAGDVANASALLPVPAGASTKLVGRDGALGELRGHLQRASSGERQIVFVTGEQGLGKTTLVEAFLLEAGAAGIAFSRGQCLEGYGVVTEPYYPVLEALGQLAKVFSDGSLVGILETHAPTWLVQLPSLLTKEHRAVLQRELIGATRERMIREACEALEKLAEEQTLVFLFEDLHWADPPTVDLLAALASRRSPARMLVIGTYRPVDVVLAQHPLKQASQSLKARRQCREIALSLLEEGEIAEYLALQGDAGKAGGNGDGEAPSQRLAHWIHKQTEGNPLFMVTVLEHLRELGYIGTQDTAWTATTPLDQIGTLVPDTLRQMIELQVDRLSAAEQLALEAASVQGMIFSSTVIASALQLETGEVEEILQRLARQHHVIRLASSEQAADGTFSQSCEFVHAAFRHVLYQRLPPARRASLHRRIGETLETLKGDKRERIAAELAGHFEQAGDWARTLDYIFLAARNCWVRYAYREANTILAHGLELAARMPEVNRAEAEMRLLVPLSIVQYAVHDVAGATATLEKVAAKAANSSVADLEGFAVLVMTHMKGTEDSAGCQALLERMEKLARGQTNPLAHAKATAHYLAMRFFVLGWEPELAKQHAAAVARIKQDGDALAGAAVMMEHCYFQWATTQYATSIKNAKECLPVLIEAGRLIRFLHGRELVAVNLALLGQWGKALDILDESADDAKRNNAFSRMSMPLVFKAWVHLKAQDFAGVAEIVEQAMHWLDAPLILDRRYIALRLAASAELGLGRHDVARRRLQDLRSTVDQRPVLLSWYWRMPLQLQLMEACLAQGDLLQARVEAQRALELTQATEERTWQALAWEASARLALLEEDIPSAGREIQGALQAIEGFDAPLAAWRVHGTAARVFGRHSDAVQERQHLQKSREIIRSLADSLQTRPTLQQTFLTSRAVTEILGRL